MLRIGPSGLTAIQERRAVNIGAKSRALLYFRQSCRSNERNLSRLFPLRADNDDGFRAIDRSIDRRATRNAV